MLRTKEKPNKNINRVDQVLWWLEKQSLLKTKKEQDRTIVRLTIPGDNYSETKPTNCLVDAEFPHEISTFASEANRSEIEYLKKAAQRCCRLIEKNVKAGKATTQLFLE
jgi:hypothetical protein